MCGLPPVFGLRWLSGDRWLLIGPNGPWASWWRLPITAPRVLQQTVVAHTATLLDVNNSCAGGAGRKKGSLRPRTASVASFC